VFLSVVCYKFVLHRSEHYYIGLRKLKSVYFQLFRYLWYRMNNIQFWIWLIVIVITLVARMRKKKVPGQTDSSGLPSRPLPRAEESSKPMTFEELLKEIEAAKSGRHEPVPTKTYAPVDYDDDIPEEAKSLERTDYTYAQPPRTNEIYEKAKQEAFFRPSLEESMKLEDTVIRFGQFKGYQQETVISPAAQFARQIKDPAGFRKAFIMSEILKRRF
jgi:hypothetical protein